MSESADRIFIERNDEDFVTYFIQTITENKNAYALSKCIDDLLQQERGTSTVLGILKLLGSKRSAFIESLLEPTINQLIERFKGKEQRAAPYEAIISAMHQLISKFEFERKIAQTIGDDEMLSALSTCDNSVLLSYIIKAPNDQSAAILSLLPPKRRKHMLEDVPTDQRKDLYQGFSKIQEFTPQYIGKTLNQFVSTLEKQDGNPIRDGVSYILELLGNMGEDDEKEFLSSLAENQDLQSAIAKRHVTPASIFKMDDRGIKSLFSEFDPKTIAHFLLITGDKMAELIIPEQNSRNQAIIKDTLSALQNSTKGRKQIRERAEESKVIILNQLREMIARKEVTLQEG